MMNKNKGFITLIIILITLASIAVGGYYLNKSRKENLSNTSIKTSI